MASTRKIETKLQFDGEKEYKEACKGINNSLKVLGSEMKVVTAQYAGNEKSIEGLTAKQNVLKKQYDEQTKKVGENEKALAALKAEENQNADAITRFEVALNNSKAALANTTNELGKTEKELDGAGKEADQFGKEVKKAGDEAGQSGGKLSKLGSIAGSVGKAFGKAMLAIGTAAAGAATALTAMTVSASNYADDVLTQSTFTRQSTDDLQKYAYAARFVDVDMNTLTKSMTKNIKTMDSARGGTGAAAEAYKKLGVSVTSSDGSLRDSNDVYWEIIDGLKGVTNETERDALAMQLLGKSGTELNSVIEAGSESFKAYGDEAVAMGAVMSGDQLNSLGDFNDKLQKLEAGMGGLKNAAASIALPFLDVLASEGISILTDFSKGIQEANGNASKMAEVVGTALSNVTADIMQRLPAFIDMGVKMIQSLIKGVAAALPTLIPQIAGIVAAMVQTLVSNIPMLIEAALQLILGLTQGLIAAMPQLVAAIPQIVETLANAIIENADKIMLAGKNIIMGLWEGILSADAWIREKVKGFFGGIVDEIKGFLGIHSPSTVFAGIGDNMALGVGEGFNESMGGVSGNMENSLAATSSASAKAAIDALSTGLTTSAELLAPAIAAIVKRIGDGLTADAPKFVSQGVEIIKKIAEGIIQGIPQLMAAIPQVVTSLLNAFNANNTKFVNQGMEIDKQIAAGIVSGIPYLVAEVPKLITAIENSFSGYMSRFQSIGESIMCGIGSGITSMSAWLDELINNYIDSMVENVESKLEIHSPSRVFAGIGEYMAQGLGVGFAKEMRSVESGIRKAIPTEFDTESPTRAVRGLKRGESSKPTIQVTQNIYTPQYDYVAQQREAAKQFKLIARQV